MSSHASSKEDPSFPFDASSLQARTVSGPSDEQDPLNRRDAPFVFFALAKTPAKQLFCLADKSVSHFILVDPTHVRRPGIETGSKLPHVICGKYLCMVVRCGL